MSGRPAVNRFIRSLHILQTIGFTVPDRAALLYPAAAADRDHRSIPHQRGPNGHPTLGQALTRLFDRELHERASSGVAAL
jgi:hypothetical protein